MKTPLFTADTHFGHKNVIKYNSRPFKDISHMDEILVQNWNSVVGYDDIVYHLGDVCMCDQQKCKEILGRLNGRIYLILGNHDKPKILAKTGRFEDIQEIMRIEVEGQRVILCHYAMLTWYQSHRGSFHLHGHSHGSLEPNPHALRLDVGVDCHNYTPITWSRVKHLMSFKTFVPIDHHQ